MLTLTVILPTYNRLSQLKLVLTGLEEQTYPLDKFEVIVVSDGSTDGTYEYLQNLQTPLQLRPIQQQNSGAAAARNTGIAHAQSELILFIDDDVVPAPNLIVEHLLIHNSTDEKVVVIGPMLNPPDYQMQPWVIWEQEMLYKQYDAMREGEYRPTARQFYTGNSSLALEYLEASGGFDARFKRAEDVELAYRLHDQGAKFVFAHKAVGYHYADRSFESWFAIPYAYGRNDIIFAHEKGQSWIIPYVAKTFLWRNIFIILLIWLLLDRVRLSRLVMKFFRATAKIGHQLHIQKLSKIAYSFMFNFQYYQGVSDELGGRTLFFENVKTTRREIIAWKKQEKANQEKVPA
ncbi:MAG: glycosyltransferase family 2 protein [Anaerolineae bacterium]|nr:glycosyltransferase family 2 protein [Anaerolineae bacterium]